MQFKPRLCNFYNSAFLQIVFVRMHAQHIWYWANIYNCIGVITNDPSIINYADQSFPWDQRVPHHNQFKVFVIYASVVAQQKRVEYTKADTIWI